MACLQSAHVMVTAAGEISFHLIYLIVVIIVNVPNILLMQRLAKTLSGNV